MNMFDLKGKVAAITGATGKLGESMSHALAGQGCDIVVVTRDKEKGDQLAGLLKDKYRTDAVVMTWNALDTESIKKLAIDAKAWKGHIDILINNAGGNITTHKAHFFDRSDEDIRAVVETNLLSPLYCCREFGRIMKEQGSGKIINIASIAGMVGRDRRMYKEANMNEQLIDYAASKGGIISMTRDLAAVLAPYGVYVNSISPGGFRHGNSELFTKLYSDRTPVGYMGRTETDLQGAVVYLASGASDYVVGQNIVVDGGFTIWR